MRDHARTWELAVRGVDCADCARSLQRALGAVPGVADAARAGFPPAGHGREAVAAAPFFRLLGATFGLVLLVVVLAERAGLVEAVTRRVPPPVWLAAILLGGAPVFRNVVRAARQGRVVAHTLMTVGLLAAVAVGEWAAAAQSLPDLFILGNSSRLVRG